MATSARLLSISARRNGGLISKFSASFRGASAGQTQSTALFGGISQRWLSTSYPSHEVVGMPSLSPTMEAGTIAVWNLKEGDTFSAGDSLCEIETDKATVSFEAQDDGAIAKILAQAGPDEISCGVPIVVTVEEEEDAAAFKDYVVDAVAAPDAPPAPKVIAAAPVPAPVAVAPVTPVPVVPVTPAAVPSGGRTMASPLAWTVAKDKGLDLTSIAIVGTGPDGRIIADDVREYIPMAASTDSVTAAAPAAVATTAAVPIVGDNYTDYPLNEASIATANLLSHSKQTIPHYYLTVDVTLDSLIGLRSTLNSTLDEGAQISLNDLLIKASACAMKSCPAANASWMGDSVRMYDNVDINVVMGNGDNLYAPLVQDVSSRGVKSISDELSSNLNSIEEGTIAGENFAAVGTVTVMNLGMYGVKSCAPIIRAPQAVALALGAAENRVVPKEGGEGDDIYETKVLLTATLSCDHRVVDGAVGAQFLSAFKAAVEKPETLLL